MSHSKRYLRRGLGSRFENWLFFYKKQDFKNEVGIFSVLVKSESK